MINFIMRGGSGPTCIGQRIEPDRTVSGWPTTAQMAVDMLSVKGKPQDMQGLLSVRRWLQHGEKY
jgi:hypothetical protein